ncbi:3438_t:CDS:2, partial [Entrophospora sp. SA101]
NKGGFKNPPTENQWGHDGYEELIQSNYSQNNHSRYQAPVAPKRNSNIHDFDFNVPSPDDIVFDARNQKGVVFDVDKKG